jgi:hypothetical protein
MAATEAFAKAEEKAVTNHGAYEERATGFEPATSSLGSFFGPCGARVFRRR